MESGGTIENMTIEQRTVIWNRIYDLIKDLSRDERIQAIQMYIQQGGPVPGSLGDKFRKLLK